MTAEIVNGNDLLAEVEDFVRSYVAFPSEAAAVAVVLWVAHAHVLGADPETFDSTPGWPCSAPNPAAASPEPRR